jgi:sucrose-6-phosphate hydrolase SacC (GH32 family)
MSLPRIVTLDGDQLRMEPIPELERLRTNPRKLANLELGATEIRPEGIRGAFLELRLEIDLQDAEEAGVKVRRSPDGAEETVISYLAAERLLRVDMSRSTLRQDVTYGQPPFRSYGLEAAQDNPYPYISIEAPFELDPRETLQLRIFVDGPVIEVFANGRQAITQQVYPEREDSVEVALFARGNATVKVLESWGMAPITIE